MSMGIISYLYTAIPKTLSARWDSSGTAVVVSGRSIVTQSLVGGWQCGGERDRLLLILEQACNDDRGGRE